MSLGTHAPAFALPDTVSGTVVRLDDLKSAKAIVVMFISNHCPYVQHVQSALVALANDYIPRGVSFVAIGSNDAASYPEDSPERMKEEAVRLGYPFVYLHDDTQDVARAYQAACTPDFYLFDGEQKLVYRGQLDSSRPGGTVPVTGVDMRNALDAVLNATPVDADQKPSIGCNIKWRKKNG